MVSGLAERGWELFPAEAEVEAWARAALPVARERMADPEERGKWLRCAGTWFVGVDALPNDAAGRVGGSEPLGGSAIAAVRALYGDLPLHRGQVSAVHPGYPKPREGEGEAAFRYRQKRDAAHVDGLHPVGADRRRRLAERHAYILGFPLTECGAGASPLSVWEGSHHIMRRALGAALADVPEADWSGVDLTDAYHAARREAFESCRRVTVPARPGEASLVHRLALHGVAPWQEGAAAPAEGRAIAYFRPELPPGSRAWLDLP